MKNLFYFATACIFICFSSCKEDSFTNHKLRTLYHSLPDEPSSIYSADYSLTDFEGNNIMSIPIGPWCAFLNREIDSSESVYSANFGWRKLSIVSFSYQRLCYKSKPFFEYSDNDHGTASFFLKERSISGNSFAIVSGYYDSRSETGGIYLNGEMIAKNIFVTGKVVFGPMDVKSVAGKIIILFNNPSREELYILFNEKTNKIILPEDYQHVTALPVY